VFSALLFPFLEIFFKRVSLRNEIIWLHQKLIRLISFYQNQVDFLISFEPKKSIFLREIE